MKKILVPIDFSDVSMYATKFAVDLAERSSAEIIFLHSMHFNYFSDFSHATGVNLQHLMNDVKESVSYNMKNMVEKLNTSTRMETRISNLNLLEAVRTTIKEDDIGVAILGTKGSSGWAELLVGSNTEKIVRWADCPIISVPSETSFDGIRKILVPIDLKEIQDEFMTKLVILQKLFSAHMEFLWVKTPHNVENTESVNKEFNQILKTYGFKDSSFTIVHNVFPSDGILEQASGLNADMIAMATHSRRGISHWLSGSLTEDTINHINLPVWTFKLDRKAKNVELLSFKDAEGKAEYKKIKTITV